MIDFNDVRIENEPTFLVFPCDLRMSLEHALKECQITDWQIMTLEGSRRYLPEGGTMPDKTALLFISHYNRDDMSRKLREIQLDPDIISWIDAGCERLIRDIWGY